MLTVGSLFAGIGGLDLGLERAGMQVKWQVENDPYCIRVLERHWPDVKRFGDIKQLMGNELESVALICGGFPCQDISIANQDRPGLKGSRSGLWWEMCRLIRILKPRWVLVENVPEILGNGMDDVLASISQAGYDAEWHTISAEAIGLPHTRNRVFILAHSNGKRDERVCLGEIPQLAKISWWKDVRSVEDLRKRPNIPQPLIRGASDGIPNWMDRLRAVGNAVVPQVAEYIGKLIVEAEERWGRE